MFFIFSTVVFCERLYSYHERISAKLSLVRMKFVVTNVITNEAEICCRHFSVFGFSAYKSNNLQFLIIFRSAIYTVLNLQSFFCREDITQRQLLKRS